MGGRVHTHDDARATVPIELGAEFIHGHPEATFSLLQEAGVAAVDATNAHWQYRDGELRTIDDNPFASVRDVIRNVDLRGPDETVDAFLARLSKNPALQDAISWTRALVEGFDAADPADASIHAIAEEWTGNVTAPTCQFRPVGGYRNLLAHIARSLEPPRAQVSLETTVTDVQWEPGRIKIRANSLNEPLEMSASCAILTVPAGVLQHAPPAEGSVRFSPLLPQEKRKSLAAIAMGPAIKLVFRFASAFWEDVHDGAYRDAAFFHSPGTFATFWTTLPLRSAELVAWAGGTNAARLMNVSEEDVLCEALDSLAELFGSSRADLKRELEAVYLHDWLRDAFSRGAYSYVKVGGDDARGVLAAPLASTLFFAGEATATNGEAGTVGGALQTGLRAAREVAEVLPRGPGAG